MDTSVFDAFSDDEDEQNNPLSILATLKRPISKTDDDHVVKEEKKPKITDDFDKNVDKEYQPETTSLKPVNESLVVSHLVRHQVALPPNYDYVPLSEHKPPEKPCRTYPFTLDPFQQTAIYSIQRNESVLVAAHTSAGKTVVAEYAIAQSLMNKQRVIYTSPIKALSNQKYRELLAEFGDVGLMTGDVTINSNASCLVMTTEILRSMLYRGSEVMREVAWVVFDEIHYMRDKERGVVWEETLILLPDKVHFVFLSATIPNAMQFAEWICQIHKQPCHVVFTDYRPTPLQHYIFPNNGDGIYLVVDEKGSFREDNFQKAISFLGSEDPTSSKKRKKVTKGTTDMFKVVQMIMKKNYHPVIVFSFSKRECESNALQLSKLDFNDDNEKEMVKTVFENAIQSLGEDDRQLPQIQHILPLLKRGIGIHHSGLLPILKEVIEILFQEGLLKVLFATETFSIGLNMPAKTVMFTSVRKFDGTTSRWLAGGEYVQMSGRAGRRGLDERGIVILMIDEKMEPQVAKDMLKGIADPLNSAFHLTYTMILNLMRVEGIPPEQMLQSSFHQFQNFARIPQLESDIKIFEKRFSSIEIEDEQSIEEYYQMKTQLDIYKRNSRKVQNHPSYCLPFLQPGRLVKITKDTLDFDWGIVINFQKTYQKDKKDLKAINEEGPTYVVDILLQCQPGTEQNSTSPKPCSEDGDLVAIPCSLEHIMELSAIRVYLPKDIRSVDERKQLLKVLSEAKKRFPDGIPLLDPVKDMGIKDESFQKLIEKMDILDKKIKEVNLTEKQQEDVLMFESKVELGSKIAFLKRQITDTESALQLDELKSRRRVLRRMGYISESGVIQTKGRVACELSCGDELLLTELIFNGVFNDLSVEQTVALLSCFTCDENGKEEAKVREELAAPLKTLRETARRIAEVSQECKIDLDPKTYVERFKPTLMDVVYSWATGSKFSQICKMTELFEGSVIRAVRRLDELLNELTKASASIGNTELESKFSQVEAAIVELNWTVGWVDNVSPTTLFTRRAVGINGVWPIPAIHANLGDRLIIHLKNQMNESTSLHFHGLFQNGTNSMDGALGITQCGIPPGQTFTYDVLLSQSGSYWVHGHRMAEYPDGFRTPLVISDPQDQATLKYDQEFTFGLADWYQREYMDLYNNEFFIPENVDGMEPIPNTILINDRRENNLTLEAGKTYRFRFISMATSVPFDVWVENHNMTIVEVDGVLTHPKSVQVLPIAAAQRYSVLVKIEAKMNFKLHVDLTGVALPPSPFQPNAYANLILDPVFEWFNFTGEAPDSSTFTDLDISPLEEIPPYPVDDYQRYDPAFTLYSDDRNHGAFNNSVFEFPNVPSIFTATTMGNDATNSSVYGPWTHTKVLGHNRYIELAIVSRDREGEHPFHLHGHVFQVLGRGYQGGFDINKLRNQFRLLKNPVRRDTVLVPTRGWIVIRFKADNPGVWLFHCHIQWHLNAGLASQFIEAPLELQKQTIPEYVKSQCRDQGIKTSGNAAGFNNTYDFSGLTPSPEYRIN